MGPHERLLRELALSEEQVRALTEYLRVLEGWNQHTNLTGLRTPADQVNVLVREILPVVPLVKGPVLDVGSGNGSPGLVLAVLDPGLKMTLLEPRRKRWAFLREVLRELGRADVDVVRDRCEDYRGPSVETATVRAVGVAMRSLLPLVRPGGQVLVFGPSPEVPSGLEPVGPPTRLWRGQVHVLRRERST